MAKLTEDMVTARARGADITTLKKLNCWGACLADVSLLQRMTKLEVIAFSVNQISSLADFANCVKLQELYLRDNRIADINQLCYLQELPALKHLLLKENPIESMPHYRETVLRALPGLDKLDDDLVTPSEVELARRIGRELVHPLSIRDGSLDGSRSPSPQRNVVYYEDYSEPTENQRVSSYDDVRAEYQQTSPKQSQRQSPPQDYEQRRNSAYEQESGYSSSRRVYSDEPASTSPELEAPGVAPNTDISPEAEDEVAMEPSCARSCRQVTDTGARLSVGSGINHRPRQPIRSSNILSSVLLLIKELDISSLEVVHVAVQSRINELIGD